MIRRDRKLHWENIYNTKDTQQVSWYQKVPETSLKLIDQLHTSKSDKIIEVGCGDSYLGDHLLQKGYTDITLLDISHSALNAIKKRLSNVPSRISYVCSDILNFEPQHKFTLWHDRAVFHFLTEKKDQEKYIDKAASCIISGGHLIVATFSDNGPDVCSKLKVQQYSETELQESFKNDFSVVECFSENHVTPSGDVQNFQFCIFKHK